MNRAAASRLAVVVLLLAAPAARSLAQQADSRDITREKMRQLLDTAGRRPDVDVAFQQSDKAPYNFSGFMRSGLTNADSLEIVVGVAPREVITVRVFPMYKGVYLNVAKVKDPAQLMQHLLRLNDLNYLFWGTDQTGDVFCAYAFTLESGFPEKAILTVLRSIRNTDRYIGELRPFIDGSSTPAQ